MFFYLEGSDKLDLWLLEDLRISFEILILDKELSIKLSDIKKILEIILDIKKMFFYLESSDVFDLWLLEYYKMSFVFKEMIILFSERWKVIEIFFEV